MYRMLSVRQKALELRNYGVDTSEMIKTDTIPKTLLQYDAIDCVCGSLQELKH